MSTTTTRTAQARLAQTAATLSPAQLAEQLTALHPHLGGALTALDSFGLPPETYDATGRLLPALFAVKLRRLAEHYVREAERLYGDAAHLDTLEH